MFYREGGGRRDTLGTVGPSGLSTPAHSYGVDAEAIPVCSFYDKSPTEINSYTRVGKVKSFSGFPNRSEGYELCHAGVGLYAREHGYGVDCGPITRGPETEESGETNHVETRVCFEANAAKGDSGGPVWINGTNVGVGLVESMRGRSMGPGERAETCAVAIYPASLSNDDTAISTSSALAGPLGGLYPRNHE